MTLLATMRQFAESEGNRYDPTDLQALRALEDASALFRSEAHQTISLVTDDVVELEGNWTSHLWLPERPVISVKDASIGFPFTTVPTLLTDSSLMVTRRGMLMTWDACAWGGPDATVRLTYTHGYADIPEDVIAVVCSIASRSAGSSPSTEGIVAETIGQHTVQYSPSSVGVATSGGLTSMELDVIRRYRPRDPR